MQTDANRGSIASGVLPDSSPRNFIGKTVYRMFPCDDDKLVSVYEARVVDVRGSWVILSNSRGEWKENGFNWAATVRDAIDDFVSTMCLYVRYDPIRFRGEGRDEGTRNDQRVELIRAAVQEAVEWGLIAGRAQGFLDAVRRDRANDVEAAGAVPVPCP